MKIRFFALSMLCAFILCGGEPIVKEVQRSYHKHSKLYGDGKYYQITCEDVAYLIYFQWVKATQTKDGQVLLGLPEPNFWSGYDRRGIFNLKVNGISIYDLEPKTINLLKDPQKAGIEVRYNFAGAQMDVRFFMDGILPVLHVECEPFSGNKPDAIKTLEMRFAVSPHVSGKPKDSYRRVLQTPVNTYSQRGWTTIKPQDTYFVMYDTIYDYNEKNPKSQGPAYLKLDTASLQKGRFHYGKCANITFELTFKPDTKKIAIDLLELAKPLGNAEFMEYLKTRKVIPAAAAAEAKAGAAK